MSLVASALIVGGLVTQIPSNAVAATGPAPESAFVQTALSDHPSALLQGLTDLTGTGPAGTAVGAPTATTLPNGDPAIQFNGNGQYLQFASRSAFSIATTGAFTVDFWMRPDTLQFTNSEGSGYVYTMGKGNPGAQEWFTRMYSLVNAENRPNRISGYAFNPTGGLGAGSYFQNPVTVGKWIHVTFVVNANAKSTTYPMGYTRIYQNGVLRATSSLASYNIVPRSGTAPLRIGTGYLGSFFQGAIGDVAIYNKELTASQVLAHDAAMYAPAPVVAAPTPAPAPAPAPTPTPVTPSPTSAPASWSTTLSGTNTARLTNELIEYTPSYGSTTGTNQWGFEAAVVGGKITTTQNGVGSMPIPANGYVLSGHGTARQWLIAHAAVGSTVTVSGSTVTITAP